MYRSIIPLYREPNIKSSFRCSPGGFTAYLLSKYQHAHGVGVSLPVKLGGPEFIIAKDLRSRFKLHLADLTSFRLHPITKTTAEHLRRLAPVPQDFRGSHLVIMDARIFLTQFSLHDVHYKAKMPRYLKRHRLLIAQIAIALRSLQLGGTAIVTLAHAEQLVTAQLLLFFRFVFRTEQRGMALEVWGTFFEVLGTPLLSMQQTCSCTAHLPL